jgi:hypothetical protein
VFKKFSLVAVAVVLMAGSAMADEISGLDLASITDADNAIVQANLDVDVDALTNKTGDNADQAVEACFRGFGGWGCGYRSYCYSYCYYPTYSYCYYPTYFCYRPVYSCYYPLYTWGCY